MTVRDFTQKDKQEFEEYLDALSQVMNHERRLLPLTSYCTGLLLPLDSKTMEAMAAVRAQVLPAMLKQGPVRSGIIDDPGLPKKAPPSVGTARQYCGQLG